MQHQYSIGITKLRVQNIGSRIKQASFYGMLLGLVGFVVGETVTQAATDTRIFTGNDNMKDAFINAWRQQGMEEETV